MHRLSSSFVLGYHGCSRETGERLLQNESFSPSANEYDWLGVGAYFWEANPDRGLDWAREVAERSRRLKGIEFEPFVVGAVIDMGFCLDLISSNGTASVRKSYQDMEADFRLAGLELPTNKGGEDILFRNLDRAVLEYLHLARKEKGELAFDTVRALFPEAKPLYPGAGFLEKTHIQICVRNLSMIKGVFRVPSSHFSGL